MRNYYDNHHTQFPGAEFSVRPEGKYIRDQLIARGISRIAHNALHANVLFVPLPSVPTLQYVASHLPQGLELFDGIDKYCSLLEKSNRRPKASPLEIGVAQLTIEATRQQLPYLHAGLPNRRFL